MSSDIGRKLMRACICMCARGFGRCCRRTCNIAGGRTQNTKQEKIRIVP
jgi:hypothetical protein